MSIMEPASTIITKRRRSPNRNPSPWYDVSTYASFLVDRFGGQSVPVAQWDATRTEREQSGVFWVSAHSLKRSLLHYQACTYVPGDVSQCASFLIKGLARGDEMDPWKISSNKSCEYCRTAARAHLAVVALEEDQDQ